MKKFLLIIFCAFILTACAGQILKQSGQDYNKGDYPAALEKLMPLAENGDAKAQYAVGYMYYYGQGVPMNKGLGEIWIDRAADQGLPAAMKAQDVIQRQKALNPLKKDPVPVVMPMQAGTQSSEDVSPY